MLEGNLFGIVLISLGLVLTSNVFGQWHPDIDRVITKKPVNKTRSIKSPRDVATGQKTAKRKTKSSTTFRPNPAGDGTTQQLGGDVHPGQDGMGGTGMVKSQSTTNRQKSSNGKVVSNPTGIDNYIGETEKGGNGYTAMPDLDANSNSRKPQTRKSSKSEVSMESIERRKRQHQRGSPTGVRRPKP